MNISADDVSAALVEWAKKEISSATDTRFELAKFLFSASGATLGFVVAAWKQFHPNAGLAGPAIFGIASLCLSIVFSMYMFWPVFFQFGADTDIQAAHENLVGRLIWEGILWSSLWTIGVGFGLWSILD